MVERIHVRPTGPTTNLVHPVDGQIASQPNEDGVWSFWLPDQFTFLLMRDGSIEEVPPPVEPLKRNGPKAADKE